MKRRVLIVGAGPSGLAAAIVAAQRGADAVVFEKRTGLLDKACGEGIMPPGVAWLRRHGVDLDGLGRPYRGIRYIEGSRTLEGPFFGAPGRAVRRLALSERMLDRATALGVRVERGATVEQTATTQDGVTLTLDGATVDGHVGVGADGLHSRVAQQLSGEKPRPPRGPVRFGARFHVRLAPWTDSVEVHWSDHGEAYVTPVSEAEVGIAFLTDERPLDASRLLALFPELARRIDGAPHSSTFRGAGPLRNPTRIRRRGYFGLVGDASGYVDACTGEGLSLGFASAESWVTHALAGRPWAYALSHRRLMARYAIATRAVLLLARSRRLRRMAFAACDRVPLAFRLAVGLAT